MDDLLSEFLTETNESLSELDNELVLLEENPNDKNLLSNIFRIVHTIKGTCGFLGLPRLEKVAHSAENVLGKFRDGELEVTPDSVTLILESLDRIKLIIAGLEATQAEPTGDDGDLIEQLNACAEGKAVTLTELTSASTSEPVEVSVDPAAPASDDVVEPVVETFDADEDEMSAEALEQAEQVGQVEKAEQKAEAVAVNDAQNPSETKNVPAAEVSSKTIRVNVELLEALMTTVSELVLTRNQLLQILRNQKESDFGAPLQRLNQVTSELQEGVMKTRMQPIGNAWSKLPRIIRDIGHDLGKKIKLEMRGQDTELDRQVLDLIKDPLTHMVRNSGDHGIERPEERAAAGKSEFGTIVLNAYHEGGHILIEITDDGRGLNLEKIKEKVLASGLATPSELEAMSDQQIMQFIFKAGLSTAEKVTNVSGRGVGMDVVRTNIEKIGGTIDLKSEYGKGTTVTIKIPLTLAIVSALIVESAGERFAVPQISVVELVRASARAQKIETINGTPVLRLRDRLLPLIGLSDLLGLTSGVADKLKEENDERFVVVTQVGAFTFGIIVDKVFDTEEIVVKPVAGFLRNIDVFSGNTILGDGSVIMILDPNGIANRAGAMAMGEQVADAAAVAEQEQREAERSALLLFRAGDGPPRAVPLALIARLEDIEVDSIEISNGNPVVQYRGQIMPLVQFDHSVMMRQQGRQPVLVFADNERTMGLMVDEILDIVEERVDIQLGGDRPGLIGSAVIAGKTTEVIDVVWYLTQAFNDWFNMDTEGLDSAPISRRVLLVDDSPFFRNLLTPLLSVAGYDVTSVDSGNEALTLFQNGESFDVVVSDIEMPGMSGFELAEKIRKDDQLKHLPLVALSSHTAQSDFEKGRAVGFSDYVAKFDREALLASLSQTLSEAKGAA